MDAAALTREEVFTDSRVGTIRKMTPVTLDGETITWRGPVGLHVATAQTQSNDNQREE